MIKAVALNWLMGREAANLVRTEDYLRARQEAARLGVRARLCWNGKWVTVPRYLDLFIWSHRHALEKMDIPEEIWIAVRLIKRRINGATMLAKAARLASQEHPRSWQSHLARGYVEGLNELLSGNTMLDFAERMSLKLPDLDSVWLGRRNLELA
jgi:hypothetical protein